MVPTNGREVANSVHPEPWMKLKVYSVQNAKSSCGSGLYKWLPEKLHGEVLFNYMSRRGHQQWDPRGQPVCPLWSNTYWSITLLGRIEGEMDDNRILTQLLADRLKGAGRMLY